MRKNQRAFTILELLVVVAIIAIIAIIAIPNFIGRIDEAKASQELAEINAVEKAIATYYADFGNYPTLQGKDGTILQAQPLEGAPHNIDFSSLVPEYLATLPHFSYWWVDYQGNVYHTEKSIGALSGSVFTPTTGYTYTLYKANGTTQVLSAPYTLLSGEYIIGADDTGSDLPKIGLAFKNEKMHPEDPEYVTPVTFTSQTFDYTGSVQTFTVPVSGTYKLEVWGAQGGASSNNSAGGKGGYSQGSVSLSGGQSLYIYVGGSGVCLGLTSSGGWNGGGSSYNGGSGGGGTDVRIVSGAWDSVTSLTSRIIAAGGGGGANNYIANNNGGNGGGLSGEQGTIGSYSVSAKGGTQTSGGAGATYSQSGQASTSGQSGSLGVGGAGSPYTGYNSAGGGGGYYGGGGSTRYSAGGGGSGYIGGVTGGSMSAGVQIGNGKVVLTYVGP